MDHDLAEEEARSLREELRQLNASMERHPALGVTQQMEELDRAMQWYSDNSAECIRTIEALNHKGLGTSLLVAGEVPYGEDVHRDYVIELGRTWHNFVAAAKTFADHMRLQFDSQPNDLQTEYEDKKRELLVPHDVVAFVSRSRNVLLHGGVFQTGVTWRFTNARQLFEANCRTDILLNGYASWWNAGARRYIESKAPRLDLTTAITEHVDVVTPIYRWYQQRVYEYHYPKFADFEATAARIREVSELLEPGSLPQLSNGPPQFVDPSESHPLRPPPKRQPKSKGKKGRKKR